MPRVKGDKSPRRAAAAKSVIGVALQDAPKKGKKFADHGSKDNNEIETPDDVFQELYAEFGAMFDPCPFVGKGKKPEVDGLSDECFWRSVNYVNPPYSDEKVKCIVKFWIERAYQESQCGKSTVLFVPNRTGSRYWDELVYGKAAELRFITGKIIFKGQSKRLPHQLAFIVYKSQEELKAQLANSNWHLSKKLTEKPELAKKYALAAAVIVEIPQKTLEWAEKPEAFAWASRLVSPEELWALLENSDEEIALLLPVFFQLVLMMQDCGRLQPCEAPLDDQKLPLPELMRRVAYHMYLHMKEDLLRAVENYEVLPLPSSTMAFFEAFFINAHQRYCMARQIPFRKDSWNKAFQQQCLYTLPLKKSKP